MYLMWCAKMLVPGLRLICDDPKGPRVDDSQQSDVALPVTPSWLCCPSREAALHARCCGCKPAPQSVSTNGSNRPNSQTWHRLAVWTVGALVAGIRSNSIHP